MDFRKVLNQSKDKAEVITALRSIKFYPKTQEVEGDKYAVVVIPTKDAEGKWAKTDLEIFKGLHMVFVVNDKGTFNYAQAINYGVAKALRHSPKWIIISNDDVYGIDAISKLIGELRQSESYDTLFFPNSTTYSNKVVIAKPRVQRIIRKLRGGWRAEYQGIMDKLGIDYEVLDLKNRGFVYANILYNIVINIPNHQGCFIVLNTDYIRNELEGRVFDETFYNGHEDTALAFKLAKAKCKNSNFNIGNEVGGSLGIGVDRIFWELANEAYFEEMLESGKNGN